MTDPIRYLCRSGYMSLRQDLGAPVMFAKLLGDGWYFVEAKDGSFRSENVRAHCSNCAKREAVSLWAALKEET